MSLALFLLLSKSAFGFITLAPGIYEAPAQVERFGNRVAVVFNSRTHSNTRIWLNGAKSKEIIALFDRSTSNFPKALFVSFKTRKKVISKNQEADLVSWRALRSGETVRGFVGNNLQSIKRTY